MTWDEVCDDPSLRNLPYKIETNGNGQIIMSPHARRHSRYQIRIQDHLLRLLPHGEPIPEAAVQTTDGVKAPDVAWASFERIHEEDERGTTIFEVAPEICIEVMSKGNPMREMVEKMRLYFEIGANEVWLCDQKGIMHFYTIAGKQEISTLCPEFPLELTLP